MKYFLWRDLGYALGALLAGFTADVLGLAGVLVTVEVKRTRRIFNAT